jgi:hypothetical protein
MAIAAKSCERTMVALYLWLGAGGGGVAVEAFSRRWILNYVFLFIVR